MDYREIIESKIIYILVTFKKEFNTNSEESSFDIIRKHNLSHQNFKMINHQTIFKSIENQIHHGISEVDFINIVKYRPKEYKVFAQQANEFLALITNLVNNTFASFSELEGLILKLKEFNLRDFWILKAQQTLSANFESTDILSFGDSIVESYNNINSSLSRGITLHSDVDDDPAKELEKRVKNRSLGISPGVKIHMHSFQEFFQGWQAPDLIIIAARPSMGKTSFIVSSLWESQKFNYNIVLVSLEMNTFQLKSNLAASITNIDSGKIKNGDLTSEELLNVVEAYSVIEKSGLNILDIRFKNLDKICSEARRLHKKGQLDALVIDYLQLIIVSEKQGSREQEVALISRTLKGLALELNIPVIALAQLSRAGAGTRRPVLTDLRESGAIEQDADVVAFLHRPTYYQDRTIPLPYEEDFKTEFIVAKGRSLGVTVLYFFNDVKKYKTIDIQNQSYVQ